VFQSSHSPGLIGSLRYHFELRCSPISESFSATRAERGPPISYSAVNPPFRPRSRATLQKIVFGEFKRRFLAIVKAARVPPDPAHNLSLIKLWGYTQSRIWQEAMAAIGSTSPAGKWIG
jgi:hypothetical protein